MKDTKKLGNLIKILRIPNRLENGEVLDSLLLIYRDSEGNKRKKYIDRARVPYYIIKDKNSPEAKNAPLFIEEDKVEEKFVYSDMLLRKLAEEAGLLNFYTEVSINYGKNSYGMKNIFKHNYFYDSDMDVADRYISYFYDEYEYNPEYEYHKTYFDIEVDLMPQGPVRNKDGSIGYMGFPEEEIAPVPVNIITLMEDRFHHIHTFVVRNKLNTSLIQFEEDIDKFKEHILKQVREDGYPAEDIFITFFDNEEDAILEFFKKVHEMDPDYAMSWNSSFDIQTNINRLKQRFKQAGSENPDFEVAQKISDDRYLINETENGEQVELYPSVYYRANKNRNYPDRTDIFHIIDGVNWIDQMLYYANIRKTEGQKESYSLDAIAFEELGKEKLDLGANETIKTLPWNNFWKFAEYNIRDVVLLYLLEKKNNDVELLQLLSNVTNTRIDKVFAKTVSIKNFISKFAKMKGFIMSNNKNARYGEMSDTFDRKYLGKGKDNIIETDDRYRFYFDLNDNYGAFVGDPNLNTSTNGAVINGRRSKFLFNQVFDLDYASLYPSIIRSFNVDKTTLKGKYYLIDNKIKSRLVEEYDYDGVFDISKKESVTGIFTPGEIDEDGYNIYEGTNELVPTFIDSLHSHDIVRTGEKFFFLDTTEDLVEDLKKKISEGKF